MAASPKGWTTLAWQSDDGQFYLMDRDENAFEGTTGIAPPHPPQKPRGRPRTILSSPYRSHRHKWGILLRRFWGKFARIDSRERIERLLPPPLIQRRPVVSQDQGRNDVLTIQS